MKETSLAAFKKNITNIKVQGASRVAQATLQQAVLLMKRSRRHSSPADLAQLRKGGENLAKIRPTEPLARNLVRWLINSLTPQVNHNKWQAAQTDLNRRKTSKQ